MKQLDQFKNGELSEKELDVLAGKIIRAKFRKEKKNKWTQQLENEHGVIRSEKKIVIQDKYFIGKYIIGIAASIIFIIAAFFIIQGNSSLNSVEIADKYLKENKFPNAMAIKGKNDVSSLELKMEEAYNKDNFLEAIKFGKQLVELDSTHSNNYFFLGLSYLYKEDLQNAEKYLLEFKQKKKRQFDQESRWFLALTYIKKKDFDKARTELEYIVAHKEWKFKLAKELLEGLGK